MIARLLSTLALTAAALGFVFSGAATAAILPADIGYGLRSAQLEGGAVYWRGYDDAYYNGYGGQTRILRRELTSSKVETVYQPEGDEAITAYNAVAGRLIVGLHNDRDDSSQIVEVKRTDAGPAITVLAQRSGDYSGLTCSSRVRLVTVTAQSEVVVEEVRRMSRDGNCARGLLKRTESKLFAIAPDLSERIIAETKAGWDTGRSDASIGRLTAGPGDWLIHRPTDNGYDENPTTPGGMRNLITGQYIEMNAPIGSGSRAWVSSGGRTLINQYGDSTILRDDPLQPDSARRMQRARTTRWLHFCGDKLLEISRRGNNSDGRRTRKSRSAQGTRWNLYILSLDGARERRLPQRLRRGTGFGTCNADTAVFHKQQRRGKVRQFSVPLTPPAA